MLISRGFLLSAGRSETTRDHGNEVKRVKAMSLFQLMNNQATHVLKKFQEAAAALLAKVTGG